MRTSERETRTILVALRTLQEYLYGDVPRIIKLDSLYASIRADIGGKILVESEIYDLVQRLKTGEERPRIESITIKAPYDEGADWSYLEQEGFEDRLQEFKDNRFTYIGIYAVAEVSYPITDRGDRRLERLESGGLWGIESDSGSEYFQEIAREQTEDLKDHLETFGADLSNFDELAEEAVTEAF